MKKLSIIAMAAVALAACSENKPTPEDYKTVEAEIQTASTGESPLVVVSLGTAGDYVLQLPKTEALQKIAQKDKTVKFLSAEINPEQVSDEYCLLNIIPQVAMEQMGEENDTCNMALFCGTADDLASGEVYAVELCSAEE